MARHFLPLYLLIVFTLAAVSWGQDRILQLRGNHDTAEDRALGIAVSVLQNQLQGLPVAEWRRFVAVTAARSGIDMELFASSDIVGDRIVERLKQGSIAYMNAAPGESWAMKRVNENFVLVIKGIDAGTPRGTLQWALTFCFYALIALAVMMWIWPLTRDLRALDRAAARFGDGNWLFDVGIKPRSQIYPLAQTFRQMAARIDGLIASHRDMSNAVSHEIKTPLARMQFEIELAQEARTVPEIQASLRNLKTDIAAIDDLVTATLSYAILERADMKLNIGEHDFTAIIPAVAQNVGRDACPAVRMRTSVEGDARRVRCDLHLLESVLNNLLHNASRYAKGEIRVHFRSQAGVNELVVEDDGPGIPEADRRRVLESFVQLDSGRGDKTGFGLGLAIVKRAIDWHGGAVTISQSPLGGARISAAWPGTCDPRRRS